MFKLSFLKILVVVIGALTTKIAFYLIIMTQVWLGLYLTAEVIFYIQTCFCKLLIWLTILLPLGALFSAEFFITLIRLRDVLHAEEVPPQTNDNSIEHVCVILENISVNLTLKNVTLELKKGLTTVTGHLGSGKTMFIKTLLGEFCVDGNLKVGGTVSYAPQEPWLFPSTIKENILFGTKLDMERYTKVLEICDLNQDLQTFTHGDNTIIGDNGVNLSKGQQARVSLARAVYKDADIYLLDDCLASLDRHVSDHIFKKCMVEFLGEKIRVFVCNNNRYVKASDYIITIKNGRVTMEKNSKVNFNLRRNKEVGSSCTTSRTKNEEVRPGRMYQEDQKEGSVEISAYRKYVLAGGGCAAFTIIILIFAIVQSFATYSDYLVGTWVTLEQNLSDYHKANTTILQKESERVEILNIYSVLIVASTGLAVIKALAFFNFARRASINLHNELLRKMVNAKMVFFDSHLIGNVLNRFSKDLLTVDEDLSFVMNDFFEVFFMSTSTVVLVTTVNVIFMVPIMVFLVVAYVVRYGYLKTGRSLQRLNSSTQSPMIGHLNATLEGITTIRAFKAQKLIIEEFERHQDLFTSAHYNLRSATRAFSFVMDGLCSIFVIVIILRFLLVSNDTPVGDVGMAMTQAIHLSGILHVLTRLMADSETLMTAVERIFEYSQIQEEEGGSEVLPRGFQNGQISFKDVSLQYSYCNALKKVSFTINPGKKIGVVGRSGAGKSSLMSALFRLYDTEGVITIDHSNIQNLHLSSLRSNIAIIPQNPILINGTIRENIDPLKKYHDDEIRQVLQTVNLKNISEDLTRRVDQNSSFSVGQKQLICLARALIRRNKVVVLDEPTASLDDETDEFIQSVMMEQFAGCTLIVVAHRKSSVLSSDVVMVMEDGRIVEMGKPEDLLGDRKSLFFEVVNED